MMWRNWMMIYNDGCGDDGAEQFYDGDDDGDDDDDDDQGNEIHHDSSPPLDSSPQGLLLAPP
jgi:hypothetical protein